MNNTNVPSHGENRLSLASIANEIVVTIWTCASFYLMYATGGKNEFVLFIPLVVGAVAFIWMTLKKPVIAKVDPLLSIGVFLLIFSILASYLFNSQRYQPIFIAGNLASTALLFIALYVITMKIELDFQKVLVFQSIFINLLLPVILATSTMVWGRLTPELHPNYVSMMGIVALIGAWSLRSIFWSLALSVLPIYTMVVMQSRASMLVSGMAAGIIFACSLWRYRSKRLLAYLSITALVGSIVCIGLTFFDIPTFGFIGDILERLFLFNDEHRGIDSGASGRTDLWSAAINLWLSHPLFGVGFKGHSFLMPDQMLAHNAYLGVLADIGLVGLAGYLIIIGVGIYWLLKHGSKSLSMYPQRAAIIFSYLLYGVIESRAFGFGNSYSLIFLLVVFDSAKRRLKAKETSRRLPLATSSRVAREPLSARSQT